MHKESPFSNLLHWFIKLLLLKRYNLDISKIDINNQNLLQLRRRSVKEQNNLQDTGGRKGGDKSETQTVSQLI